MPSTPSRPLTRAERRAIQFGNWSPRRQDHQAAARWEGERYVEFHWRFAGTEREREEIAGDITNERIEAFWQEGC